MVIKASSGAEVKALVEALVGGDEVMRESALARLTIIGSRAMDRLIAAYTGTRGREPRIALLRAMESIADRRAAPLASRALSEGGDVAVAAARVLRALLGSTHTPTSTAALDALVSMALDRGADERLRFACFEALQDVPGDVRERLAAALREEGGAALQIGTDRAPRGAAALWNDALAGRLPDDPSEMRGPLRSRAASAPLAALQKLLETIRAQEATVRSAARRAEWRALRGALHQALALRGSRVALYDLRETVAEAVEPLPISYLAAMHVLGDSSCLEPLAAAFARAQRDDGWWRHQLATAFQAVVKRERITKRHGVMKRIQSRWPKAAVEIAAQ